MKRCMILSLAVLLLLCGLLTACSSGGGQEADVVTLTDEMKTASELPVMLGISTGDEREERGFAAISDLDYEKVDAFSLLYAADGSAYELAVVRLRDESDSAALQDSLKAHIDSRVRTFRAYRPEEVPRAESAVVAAHGRYVALIMCGDPSAVKAVFDRAVG